MDEVELLVLRRCPEVLYCPESAARALTRADAASWSSRFVSSTDGRHRLFRTRPDRTRAGSWCPVVRKITYRSAASILLVSATQASRSLLAYQTRWPSGSGPEDGSVGTTAQDSRSLRLGQATGAWCLHPHQARAGEGHWHADQHIVGRARFSRNFTNGNTLRRSHRCAPVVLHNPPTRHKLLINLPPSLSLRREIVGRTSLRHLGDPRCPNHLQAISPVSAGCDRDALDVLYRILYNTAPTTTTDCKGAT